MSIAYVLRSTSDMTCFCIVVKDEVNTIEAVFNHELHLAWSDGVPANVESKTFVRTRQELRISKGTSTC